MPRQITANPQEIPDAGGAPDESLRPGKWPSRKSLAFGDNRILALLTWSNVHGSGVLKVPGLSNEKMRPRPIIVIDRASLRQSGLLILTSGQGCGNTPIQSRTRAALRAPFRTSVCGPTLVRGWEKIRGSTQNSRNRPDQGNPGWIPLKSETRDRGSIYGYILREKAPKERIGSISVWWQRPACRPARQAGRRTTKAVASAARLSEFPTNTTHSR